MHPPDHDLRELEERIRYSFRDRSLLESALTHPSYSYEQNRPVPHNQRLEFLGDAVLQIVITEYLFLHRPEWPEGKLTEVRSLFARGPTLARVARGIRLGEFLRLGRGEAQGEGRSRPAILADALEAIFGAVFLDGGLDAAREVVLRVLRSELDARGEARDADNPKGRLQEWAQYRNLPRPAYRVVEESGPEHDKTFRIVVEMDGRVLGEGVGRSKRSAETEAARAALETLEDGKEPDLPPPDPSGRTASATGPAETPERPDQEAFRDDASDSIEES